MSTTKVLLGVLAGAAAGVTLGILFAPEKGSVTRKNILKKRNEYLDGLSDLVDSAKEKFDFAKDEAESVISNGKAKANEFKSDIKRDIKPIM